MNRVDWANNKMRLAQDKILRLKERLEAELSNKEGVQALRNEDRLKLDQVLQLRFNALKIVSLHPELNQWYLI